MRKSVLLITVLAILLMVANSVSVATEYDLTLTRPCPLQVNRGITANFGQFRSKTESYKIHDGIDYRTRDIRGSTKEVYPIEDGVYSIHPDDDNGFGKYVIVTHTQGRKTFQTRYAHLSQISVEAGTKADVNRSLGLSGNTDGNKGKSTGPHLHFGLGIPDVSYNNTVNPILAGLKQSEYGKLEIREDFGIKLLATGIDGTFDETNEVVEIPEPDKPIRAVIEAYHKTNGFPSNPYKVEFEVEKIAGASWPKQAKTIVFDTMQHIMSSLESNYCFSKPFVTLPFTMKGYYFIKFYPTAGIYKITARIYSCYRDDSGFHLSEPETVTRTITVGLVGVDFNATGYSYAWLPDDLANRGIMLASTPTPVGAAGVRAAAVGATAVPEIFYAFANNNVITTNLLDVDPNLQQKALIEARCTPEANWLVEIKNSSGVVVDRISVPNQSWLRTEWGAGKPAGTYTFTVTASNSAGITTYESYDTITIDNTRPSALVYTVTNSVSTAEQVISTKFKPSEDLRSLVVNVVKDKDYSLVEERIYSSPFVEKDKEETIDWEDAIAYPDGFYRLEYVMTDVAGNIAKAYSPVVSVNKSGDYLPPSTTVEVTPEPTLPELPKWEDRPKVSDVAFDSAGNKYVLYGRYDKLVKYDSTDTVVASVEGLRCPLGLAVSPSGDRVYVANTYAQEVLVFDADLKPLAKLTGRNIYKMERTHKYYYYWPLIRVREVRGGSMIMEHANKGEYFFLPTSIKVSGNGDVYVIDKDGHRLLWYDKNLEGKIFPKVVLDVSNDRKLQDWYRHHGSDIPQLVPQLFEKFFKELGNLINGEEETFELTFRSNEINDLIYPDPYNWSLLDSPHRIPGWGPGNQEGRLSSPESATVDPSGNIYIADTGNHRIQKFAPSGEFVGKFGEGILNSPKGIDVDAYGNIWVADSGNQRIVQFNALGEFVREYKSDEYAINPQKIKVKEGKIYIADVNSNRPLVWNIGGELANVRVPDPWFSPNGDGKKVIAKVLCAHDGPKGVS